MKQLLGQKVLDSRDYEIKRAFTDLAKVAIYTRDILYHNSISHGHAKSCMAFENDKRIVSIHDDYGFKTREECVKKIAQFGETTENGYYNMAEKKLILFSRNEDDDESVKLFFHPEWKVGFKSKLVRDKGLSYSATYELSDEEFNKYNSHVNKAISEINKEKLIKLNNNPNKCYTLAPRITEQNPLTGKNFNFISTFCQNLPPSFLSLYLQESGGRFFSVDNFEGYINHLSGGFTVPHNKWQVKIPLKLSHGDNVKCTVDVEAFLTPNFDGEERQLMLPSSRGLVRPPHTLFTSPQVILKCSVLKKISGGYSRFEETVQTLPGFDYRAWGIRLSKITNKEDIETFAKNLFGTKIDSQKIKHADPSIVLVFDISDCENKSVVGHDSFDLIPGLFVLSGRFIKNIVKQFEQEDFLKELRKNDDFRSFVTSIEKIMPEEREDFQGFKRPILSDGGEEDIKLKKIKCFNFKTKQEIKPSDELSVNETHYIYFEEAGKRISLYNTKGEPLFSEGDESINYNDAGDDVLEISVPSQNLTLPQGSNIKIRNVCTQEEYKNKKSLSYKDGGPSPNIRSIRVTWRQSQDATWIAKWKEVPEDKHPSGGRKFTNGESKIIKDESLWYFFNSEIPISKYNRTKNRLSINKRNKYGHALGTNNKSEVLQKKADDIYEVACAYASKFSIDLETTVNTTEADFISENIDYEGNVAWYTEDKAIFRHIEMKLKDFYDQYTHDSSNMEENQPEPEKSNMEVDRPEPTDTKDRIIVHIEQTEDTDLN